MLYGLRARAALEARGFKFTHALGQNFLLDDDRLEQMVAAAQVNDGENVVEIGPGAGALTGYLLDAGANVLAIELDATLKEVFDDITGARARLMVADALKLDIAAEVGEAFGGAPYRVVANLPYYITSDALERLFLCARKPQSIAVTVQREAAERLMSKTGEKGWCALAALAALFADCEALAELPPEAFTPPPHVNSSFIRFTLKPLAAQNEAMTVRAVKAAFAMRRKTLANNLTAAFAMPRDEAIALIEGLGFSSNIRGEALTPAELCALSDALYRRMSG